VDTCEICGATGDFERLRLREMLFGTREEFGYHRCPACGVLRIEQVPDDLGRHYPDDYYAGYSGAAGRGGRVPEQPVGMRLRGLRAANRATVFGASRPSDRVLRRWAPRAVVPAEQLTRIQALGLRSYDDPVLEVGCGRVPRHLLDLQAIGFANLTGIDPFLERDDVVAGILLRRLRVQDATGTYRAVTFHHSFEHVPDPAETLAAAVDRLADDGTILIRTPVGGTFFWRTFGTDWWELDAPRHLFVHTCRSLELLAAAAGLEIVRIVWDTTFLELIASIQIQRDVAWREPASWNVSPPGSFDKSEIAAFKRQAAELNAAGDGGRAGLYLRRRAVSPAG
jgi:SAM-dependent methyltransferase